MTKYRLYSDGHVNFLQYLHIRKIIFFTKKTWKYVWCPYYDVIWGRYLENGGYNTFVCDYNNKLADFIKKWPDIKEYFKWAEEEQKRLESISIKYYSDINNKKGIVKYL